MTADQVSLLAAVGGEPHELPFSPYLVGVGAFVLLAVALAVTLLFGKDR